MLFFAVCGLIVGAVLGSYLGCAYYRIPRHLSLNGRSFCPGCNTALKSHWNVPVIAFLALRGRAACCGARLSPSYLLLELSSATLLGALTATAFATAGITVALLTLICTAVLVIGGSLALKLVVDARR